MCVSVFGGSLFLRVLVAVLRGGLGHRSLHRVGSLHALGFVERVGVVGLWCWVCFVVLWKWMCISDRARWAVGWLLSRSALGNPPPWARGAHLSRRNVH